MANVQFMSMRWLRLHIKEIIWTTVILFVLSCFLIGYGTSQMNQRIRDEQKRADDKYDRMADHEADANKVPEEIKKHWAQPAIVVALPTLAAVATDSRKINVGDLFSALTQYDEYKKLMALPPQVRAAFGAQFKDNVVRTLVAKALSELYARAKNIAPSVSAQALVSQEMAKLGGSREMERKLRQQGLDLNTYTEMRREQLLMQAVYDHVTKASTEKEVTDAHVSAFYNERKEQFRMKDEIALAHVLFMPNEYKMVASVSEQEIKDEYLSHPASFTTGPRADVRHFFVKAVTPDSTKAIVVSKDDIEAEYAARLKDYQRKEQVQARHILIKPRQQFSRDLETCSIDLDNFRLIAADKAANLKSLITGTVPADKALYVFDVRAVGKKPGFKLTADDIKLNGSLVPSEASLALLSKPAKFPFVSDTRNATRETVAILVPASFTPEVIEIRDRESTHRFEIGAAHDDELAFAAAEKNAQDIYSRIEKGEEFEKLAQEFSDDPQSKINGGDLGWFSRGEMVKPFEEAAFSVRPEPASGSAKPGKLVGPVKTNFGWHVIRVEGYKAASTMPLDSVRSEIVARLTEERAKIKTENDVEMWRDLVVTQRSREFAAIVASHSMAPSAAAGGKLPAFFKGTLTDDYSADDKAKLAEIATEGRIIDEIEEAVFKLKDPGEVSPIIRTGDGFHMFQLVSWANAKTLDLTETLKDRIRENLLGRKAEQAAKDAADKAKTAWTVETFAKEAEKVNGGTSPEIASVPFSVRSNDPDFSMTHHVSQISADGRTWIPELHAAIAKVVQATPDLAARSGRVDLAPQIVGPIKSELGWHLVLVRYVMVNRYEALDTVKDKIRRYISQMPSEQEINEYFTENQQRLDVPETRHCRQILLTTERDANDIHRRLKAGELFSMLARQNSIDGSSANNGDIGWLKKGSLPANLDEKVFSLAQGQYTDPVNTPYGWVLVLVEEIKAGKKATLDAETKDRITKALREKIKQESFEGFIDYLSNLGTITRFHDKLALL